MLAAVTAQTRLVLVCTSNNPTGGVVEHEELLTFLNEVPSDVVVLIDEAYVEFVTDPAAARGASLFRQHPNVVVARTFSKAYGPAGLRVGYGLAPVNLAATMRTLAVPFGDTALAQAAAIASLDAGAELGVRIEPILAERTRVMAELRSRGYDVPKPTRTSCGSHWARRPRTSRATSSTTASWSDRSPAKGYE